MMNDDELTKLEAAMARMTPGEWERYVEGDRFIVGIRDKYNVIAAGVFASDDANGIALLRNAAPALVRDLRAAREARADLMRLIGDDSAQLRQTCQERDDARRERDRFRPCWDAMNRTADGAVIVPRTGTTVWYGGYEYPVVGMDIYGNVELAPDEDRSPMQVKAEECYSTEEAERAAAASETEGA